MNTTGNKPCGFALCFCTHTDPCYRGWLDSLERTGETGNLQLVRCPTCADARSKARTAGQPW